MKERLVILEDRFLAIMKNLEQINNRLLAIDFVICAKKCDEQGTYPAIRVEQGEYVVTKKEHAIGTHSVNQCIIIYISKGEYHGLCHIDGHAEIHSLAQFFERFSGATSDIEEKIEVKIYGAKKKAISSGLNDPRLSLHKLKSFLEQEYIKKSLQEQNIDQLIKNRDQLSEGNTPSHFTIKVGEEISDKIPSDEIAIYRALHWIQDIKRRDEYLGTYSLIEGYSSIDHSGTNIYLDERAILILRKYANSPNRYDEEIQKAQGNIASLSYNHCEHTPAVKVVLVYQGIAIQKILEQLEVKQECKKLVESILLKTPLWIGDGIDNLNQQVLDIVRDSFSNIVELEKRLILDIKAKAGATIKDALVVTSRYAQELGFTLNYQRLINDFKLYYYDKYGKELNPKLIRLKRYGAEISVQKFIKSLMKYHPLLNDLIIINSRSFGGWLFSKQQYTVKEVQQTLERLRDFQLQNIKEEAPRLKIKSYKCIMRSVIRKLNEYIESANQRIETELKQIDMIDGDELIKSNINSDIISGLLKANRKEYIKYLIANRDLTELTSFVIGLPGDLKEAIISRLKSKKIKDVEIYISDTSSYFTVIEQINSFFLGFEFSDFHALSVSFDIASQVQSLTGMGFEVTQQEYWYEYNQFGLDKLLLLRLEQLQLNTCDSLQIIKSGFVLYNFNESISLLALNILQVASPKTTLLPLNIEQQHWAGLVIQKENRTIKISYLDSSYSSAALVEELMTALSRLCLNYKIDFKVIAVEEQRYNNCGPELIENFVFYLTGDRFSQEDALYMHSYLYEQNLLMQEDDFSQADAKTNSKCPTLYLGHEWLENKILDAIIFCSMEIIQFTTKRIEMLVSRAFPEQQSDWNIAHTLFYIDLLNSALDVGGIAVPLSKQPTPDDEPYNFNNYDGLIEDREPTTIMGGNMTNLNVTEETDFII